MEVILLVVSIILSLVCLALIIAVLKKQGNESEIQQLKVQLRDESERTRSSLAQANSELRNEITTNINTRLESFGNVINNSFKNYIDMQKAATESQSTALTEMRRSMENNLRSIQEDNNQKLEKMRETVDEKLSATLEKRLTESFDSVNKQLESVYKGLGEMQTLASSVGDLKLALTNVKVRGTWGEVSLESLLSQLLTPEQYERNVKPYPRATVFVEFCIKLPNIENDNIVYLPIDCKFPIEQYTRMCEASEKGDTAGVGEALKELEKSIKLCARTIREKYINPPYTTDFAIMYLPIEGLYAEVARRTGLCELLQREYRVTVAGPTTIGAFLNSLQLGFKTLAIQKRTSEISSILIKIKKNFGIFAELLEKTENKIDDAKTSIEAVTKRYSMIDKLLEKTDTLSPSEDVKQLNGEQ